MEKKLLEKIVTKAFSSRKISSCTQFETGLSESKVYKVILSDKNIWVVKIFPSEYFKRAKNQVVISKELEKHDIPTAETFFEDYDSFPDKGFIIMNYIEGITLYEHFKKNSVNEKMMNSVGRKLSKLHEILISEVWQDKGLHINSKKDWIKFIKKKTGELDDIKRIQNINRVKSLLNEFTQILVSEEIEHTPLHWDYNPQNILIHKNRVVAVLDFESTKIGDPLADVGIFLYWLKFYGKEELFESFNKGYFKEDISTRIRLILNGYATLQTIIALKCLQDSKDKAKEVQTLVSILKNS